MNVADAVDRAERLRITGGKLPRQITNALCRSPYLELRAVSCQWEGGRLVLRGRVPSFYIKQMAQAVVAKLSIEERIIDLIEVESPAS